MNKIRLILLLFWCSSIWADEFDPQTIHLPPGFKIDLYADHVPYAREMTLGKNGVVFVGTKNKRVYALIPNQEVTKTEKTILLINNLNSPHGVAYLDGNLYIGDIDRILMYSDIDNHLSNLPSPSVVVNLPDIEWHGMRPINFSSDKWLYVAIGMPCNTCAREQNAQFGTIIRIKPDGSQQQVYAKGIRNSVGFDWQPQTNVLWFTDNGQDFMGDDLPPDEINQALQQNMDFGFPYVYGDNIPTPDYPHSPIPVQNFTKPAFNLPAHVAALGLRFYTGNQFPQEYHNQIFVAEHGSWNRSSKIGYQIVCAFLKDGHISKVKPFAYGWLKDKKVSGRPVDLLNMPDGSLLVSDDFAGRIYRISYQKS